MLTTTVSEELLQSSRLANINAVSMNQDADWGIHFDSDRYVVFPGGSYAPGAATNMDYLLPPGVEISNISLEGGGDDVIFDRGTGETDQFGYIYVNPTGVSDVYRQVNFFSDGFSEMKPYGIQSVEVLNADDSRYGDYNISRLQTTYMDNDNFGFVGRYNTSNERVSYWRKLYNLSQFYLEPENIHSIQVFIDYCWADYQGSNSYCDNNRPMEAVLVGDQDVEFYNWDTLSWDSVGVLDDADPTNNASVIESVVVTSNFENYISSTDDVWVRFEFDADGIDSGSDFVFLVDFIHLHVTYTTD